MRKFDGFADETRYSSVPNAFFSAVMPDIDDIDEMKASLYAMRLLIPKRGYPRYVSFGDILEGSTISEKALRRGLKLAVSRGTILSVALEHDDIYLLNTKADRDAVDKILNGHIHLGSTPKGQMQEQVARPNVFDLYERNIGVLTPMIAEELKEAEDLYPPDWIEEAIKEAVSLNVRKWRYIASILERWAAEGKEDGKTGPDSKKDKYYKGKYSHLYRR
ncbi:DnaD domain-containing protein [Chloroflexota bacterium]